MYMYTLAGELVIGGQVEEPVDVEGHQVPLGLVLSIV